MLTCREVILSSETYETSWGICSKTTVMHIKVLKISARSMTVVIKKSIFYFKKYWQIQFSILLNKIIAILKAIMEKVADTVSVIAILCLTTLCSSL